MAKIANDTKLQLKVQESLVKKRKSANQRVIIRDFKLYQESDVFPPEMKRLEAYFHQSQINAKKREAEKINGGAKKKGKQQ